MRALRALPIRRATAAVTATVVLSALPTLAAADAPARPVTPASHQAGPGAVRHIALQGAVNVRDLGGHRTDNGRQIRYGQVFRGDALGGLTDADLAVLSALDLRTVLDFRTPEEVAQDGADRLPGELAPTARPVADLGLYATTKAVIGSKDPVRQHEVLGNGRAEQLMRDIYRTFVTDADSRRQFATAIRDIAHHKGAPLLFHCTSGKDRTGWMSYLLLRAVGVPSSAAERDYLLSNYFRGEADRKVREGLKQAGYMENPELLVPLQEVRADYLGAALDQIRKDYGSFHSYLGEGLSLDARTLAKLRARLVR
ncbi:tyrosine-protein phosphatase [Streptomyces sp. NPDC018352]|uniref:tyrosine-protein phosphatase n=1 Tax=Streptomyces sp. NPDC018352 TaxID=3157194 RepID=UPI0033E2E1EF